MQHIKEKNRRKTGLFFIVVIVFVLMLYLIFRTLFVPFTHDEAATFFHYVHLRNLFPPITREEANNHYLNTLFTFISYQFFGSDKWALRLPNVLGALLFFYFLYKISGMLASSFLHWGLFLCTAFSIYFLDFFALSRGYGLSMAFLIATLYYTIQHFYRKKIHMLLFAALFLFLMLAANLTTIIPAIALLLLHLLLFVFTKSKKKAIVLLAFLFEFVSIAVALFLLLKLKHAGALYLGTPNGGLLTTVKSWLFLFTGNTTPVKLIILFILIVFLLFSAIYKAIKKSKSYFQSVGFVFDFLLWVSLVGSVLAVNLFSVYYPEGRVGLYFFPLFMGSLFFAVDNLQKGKWPLLFVVPALFFPVYFITHINFSYAQAYKNEVIPQRFYEKVLLDTAAGRPTIAGYHMETTTWAYYNYKNGGRCNLLDWTGFPDTEQDYQLFNLNLFPEIVQEYDTADYEPLSHLALMKRKHPVEKKLIKTISITASKGVISKPYFNLYIQKNKIENHRFLFDVRLSVWSPENPLHVWLVLQAIDSTGKSNIYKFIPLDCLKDRWDGTKENFKQTLFSGKIPQGTRVLKIYLWNMDKQSFKIKDGEMNISEAFLSNKEKYETKQ